MNWLDKLWNRPKPESTTRKDSLAPAERERAITEIDDYAGRDIAGGFRTEAEIVESVAEVLADEFESVDLGPLVAERTRILMERRREEEATWPAVTDCDRLDRAFAELESRGVVCRQDFSCCGNCGSGEIRTEMEEVRKKGDFVRGYSFYHMQDTESAVEGGSLYLAYGAADEGESAALRIGHEICDAIRAQGLNVDWDGSWEKRILVTLDWKRRRVLRCSRT